jgi:protein phosphatase
MQLIIGQRSDTGQVRELDEDSLFVLTMSATHESQPTRLALFVVADGMGGHEGGEVASKVAIQALAKVLVRSVFTPELSGAPLSPEAICNWMIRAVEAANDQVYLERQKRQSDMGTTMTVALIKDWTLCLAHVGDCRAYRWGTEGLQQLTTDHSVVASMVAAGTADPEEIYTHPQRSVIYRCIGDRPVVEVDTAMVSLYPGDRLVLCCDGLWEMIRVEGIEDIMLREADPQTACDVMIEQANLAGGSDNISVIVVQL